LTAERKTSATGEAGDIRRAIAKAAARIPLELMMTAASQKRGC
jgi:hypothetical protein